MKDTTNLFNGLAHFYKQEEPYVYAFSHYVAPIILLSIVLGGLLNKVGSVHPLCSLFLFLAAVAGSGAILGVAMWDKRTSNKSQSNS